MTREDTPTIKRVVYIDRYGRATKRLERALADIRKRKAKP